MLARSPREEALSPAHLATRQDGEDVRTREEAGKDVTQAWYAVGSYNVHPHEYPALVTAEPGDALGLSRQASSFAHHEAHKPWRNAG
jgi:hypothetical protein